MEEADVTTAIEQESGGGEVADAAAESGPVSGVDEAVDDLFRRVVEELSLRCRRAARNARDAAR
ncbi:hypothetical protein OHB12_02405 [Nocardia sp. NBC_01730]|uniref:hypothetical protein n=1 Tax=Nocardia sp. NBC_01730 TaxID=2975998 RepID=UPI002E12D5CC|nr:hypothetical protein OHB12_02405 [Nocardia sp. NBC_01730]